MTDKQMAVCRRRLQPQLQAYLKRERRMRGTLACDCPNPRCGEEATLHDQIDLATHQPVPHWSCDSCGCEGDLLDYVRLREPGRSENDLICRLYRTLGLSLPVFDAVSAQELMAMRFPPKRWLIRPLLASGLYVLSGASKIGKSWLVLYLADRVSKGEPVWDMPTAQGEVLYLSLEDTPARLQQRLQIVTGGSPGPVHLATEAGLLGESFEEQLTRFLRDYPKTVLVIIDTLQRIRQLGSENYTYAGDYATMGALKHIADEFDVTILLVHHNRKMSAEDPMDMVSGTTGIAGAADGSLVLQKSGRLSNSATLTVTGRDTDDQQLRLAFDRESMRWQLLGRERDPQEEENDALLKAVAELAQACGGRWEGCATELLAALECEGEMTPSELSTRLQRGAETLRKLYRLELTVRRTREKRLLTLQARESDAP